MPKIIEFTKEQKRTIRNNYKRKSNRYIGELVGCGEHTIAKFLRENNLILSKEEKDKKKGREYKLSEENVNFIKEHYLEMPITHIAKKIKSGVPKIKKTLKELGLEIPQELVEERKRRFVTIRDEKN